jgi:hypothetical protein
VTSSWLLALTESVLDHRALLSMRNERVPRTGIDWDCDAGLYTVDVYIDGAIVAMGTARTLEKAAQKAWRDWEMWVADQPIELENALEASIAERRKAAGGGQ